MNGELPKTKMCMVCGGVMKWGQTEWECRGCDFRQGLLPEGEGWSWYYRCARDGGPLDVWVVPAGAMMVMGNLA